MAKAAATTKAKAKKTTTKKAKATSTTTTKAVKAEKVETISTRQLSVELAEKYELTNKDALALIDETIALISEHLVKGKRVRLNKLGILSVKKRAARMGRNPATGEAIKIKASKKVSFRAAKELKESV